MTLSSTFVEPFGKNSTRKNLFIGYLRYNQDLARLLNDRPYEQWIDGSFISKKLNPSDIDLVTFISHEVVNDLGDRLAKFQSSLAKENYGIDGYVVRVYPESHRLFVRTSSDTVYWRHWFGTTKLDRHKRRHNKGFVKINF